jgi:hypothetical protein
MKREQVSYVTVFDAPSELEFLTSDTQNRHRTSGTSFGTDREFPLKGSGSELELRNLGTRFPVRDPQA